MRREGDRRLITEVLLERGGRAEMRILEPGSGPAGLMDLLRRQAVAGDLVTLVHVGDTWTASTVGHEWPFGDDTATHLLADRSPAVVERAESRVVQFGGAGNIAVVSGARHSRQRFPRWIFNVTRRPAGLVVGWTARHRSPRLLAFSRSADFLAPVDGTDPAAPRPPVPPEVAARRVPTPSVVYRLQMALPPVRRYRDGNAVGAVAAAAATATATATATAQPVPAVDGVSVASTAGAGDEGVAS